MPNMVIDSILNLKAFNWLVMCKTSTMHSSTAVFVLSGVSVSVWQIKQRSFQLLFPQLFHSVK